MKTKPLLLCTLLLISLGIATGLSAIEGRNNLRTTTSKVIRNLEGEINQVESLNKASGICFSSTKCCHGLAKISESSERVANIGFCDRIAFALDDYREKKTKRRGCFVKCNDICCGVQKLFFNDYKNCFAQCWEICKKFVEDDTLTFPPAETGPAAPSFAAENDTQQSEGSTEEEGFPGKEQENQTKDAEKPAPRDDFVEPSPNDTGAPTPTPVEYPIPEGLLDNLLQCCRKKVAELGATEDEAQWADIQCKNIPDRYSPCLKEGRCKPECLESCCEKSETFCDYSECLFSCEYPEGKEEEPAPIPPEEEGPIIKPPLPVVDEPKPPVQNPIPEGLFEELETCCKAKVAEMEGPEEDIKRANDQCSLVENHYSDCVVFGQCDPKCLSACCTDTKNYCDFAECLFNCKYPDEPEGSEPEPVPEVIVDPPPPKDEGTEPEPPMIVDPPPPEPQPGMTEEASQKEGDSGTAVEGGPDDVDNDAANKAAP